jgi:hypothetical protein
MAQDPPQPHKQRTRKPSAARLLKGAMAAGLTVRGIELDPSGTLRVLVGKSGKDKSDVPAPRGGPQD